MRDDSLRAAEQGSSEVEESSSHGEETHTKQSKAPRADRKANQVDENVVLIAVKDGRRDDHDSKWCAEQCESADEP
jgi:hypothetical protein